MTITIPLWLLVALLPIIAVILISFKFSDVNGIGGSDRGWFLIFFFPISVILSLIVALLHYMGLY